MALTQASYGPIFRPESGHSYLHHPYTDIEKRQLFLRSYQFSIKKKNSPFLQRIKGSFFRVRKVIWVAIRSSKKIRRLLWFRLKYALLFSSRKKRFIQINSISSLKNSSIRSWSPSSFLW